MSITLCSISEIKKELGIPTLNLARQVDEAGEKTPFLSHWDNDRRIRVLVHEDTVQLAKESGSQRLFFIKKTEEETKGGPNMGNKYTRVVLCSANIETTI